MTTVDPVRDPATLNSPYPGMDTFAQENAPFFFGRDAERRVLISNLRASRLTLLYAQSGAGKSSLLRAGVAARLVQLAGRSIDQQRTARNVPIVFSSWRDDPTEELIEAVQQTITAFLPQAVWTKSTETLPNVAFDAPRTVSGATLPHRRPTARPRPTRTRLSETLKAASKAADATLLVMLDQFEEYFLYRSKEAQDGHFADELAACIKRADLRANFLISIREDAYSGLGDLFKSRIANVYGNYLHLENLGRECARQAIERPVASFNELHPHSVPVEIEPGLVDMVLDELGPGQFVLNGGGRGRVSGANGDRRSGGDIAASYLQLVMKRLWETEVTRGSRTLHRATLEKLGGAQTIVRTHVDRALGDLPDEDREAAVDIFHHLVTPSGTKIALAASDLAEYTGRPAGESSTLLERLASSDTRILRPVPPPPGQEGGTRYEISHDLLATPILDWSGRQRAVRLEREKESAKRVAHVEKRRARMFRTLALGSGVLLIIAIVALVVAVIAAHKAQRASQNAVHQRDVAAAGQLINKSAALGDRYPTTSKLLSLAAWRIDPTSDARYAMLAAAASPAIAGLSGHTDRVHAVAFSPNGKILATGSYDRTIRLWNVATHRQLGALTGTSGDVYSVAFSPNGKILASGGDDRSVRLWDVRTHRQLGQPLNGHDGEINSVAFSPDGKILASGGENGTVRLWDVRTRRQLGTALPGHMGKVWSVAFSPDGKTLASGGADGTAQLWDVASRRPLGFVQANRHPVLSVAFSHNSKILATGGDDGAVRLWDAATLQPIRSWLVGSPAFNVAFSPNGKLLASGNLDDAVQLWDAATGQAAGSPLLGYAVAFNPDGKTLATGAYDHTVRLWNVASSAGLATLAGHTRAVFSVAFSPQGKTLASGSADGAIQLWNVATHRQVGNLQAASGKQISSVAFSPDGKTLASGGADGTVRWWDVATGRQLGQSPTGTAGPISSVTFSHDGKTLASGGADGKVRLWDVRTHRQLGQLLDGRDGEISSVAFSPDGKILASGGENGTVQLWDVAAHHQAGRTMTGHAGPVLSVAFSPDGKTLASGGADDTVRLWNLHTHRPIGKALTGHADQVLSVAFGARGQTLASGSADGTVRLWHVATHQQIGNPLFVGTKPVTSVTFSPDGKTLASGGTDGTVRLWDVAYLANTAQQLCEAARSTLTPYEWEHYLPTGPAYRNVCPRWG